ncbi:MAG TPA: hypothetical protein VMA13_10710 [Candidatus Saccharimonadales bacterium]|nr:hypothetical protein [Candidatus Saccharimonadales bacterium]
MKSVGLFVLFFGLCSLKTARAAEPVQYHLDLNHPSPKAGDQTERTIQVFSTTSNVNPAESQETETNSSHFFELKGREKILSWDVTNDLSKVEITVQRLVEANDGETNELVAPGTQLIGTSILGESFFDSTGEAIPEAAYEQLKQFYNIRPHGFDEFAHMKLPPQLAVGQIYEIPPPTNSEEMAGILGASFTNGVNAACQLVGTTNLYGFDCLHLQIRANYTGTPGFLQQILRAGPPAKMILQVAFTADLFVPLDPSQRILMKIYSMDISSSGTMDVNGKPVAFSRGRSTLKIISESQPISQQ